MSEKKIMATNQLVVFKTLKMMQTKHFADGCLRGWDDWVNLLKKKL